MTSDQRRGGGASSLSLSLSLSHFFLASRIFVTLFGDVSASAKGFFFLEPTIRNRRQNATAALFFLVKKKQHFLCLVQKTNPKFVFFLLSLSLSLSFGPVARLGGFTEFFFCYHLSNAPTNVTGRNSPDTVEPDAMATTV